MFGTDYLKYFSRRIHNTDIRKMEVRDHLLFWTGKLFFIAVYIAIPVAVVGWKVWFVGFMTAQFAMGLTLALVFQLAHVVEEAEFKAVGADPVRIENEWAIHQVLTTANFAARNRIVTWMVGGLNYQIEHHLFPRISHVHYPALSRIVQETCARFGLPYNYFPTTRMAIASHYRFMREMGRRPS
jgi:linoleoyl-CoA desaturase